MNTDPFHLQRFVDAQNGVAPPRFQRETYAVALCELQNCRKTKHWMWYIFPQEPLGESEISKYYSIRSTDEAVEFLNHPDLGERYLCCLDAVLTCLEKSVQHGKSRKVSLRNVFGSDDKKFNSSIDLFEKAGQGMKDVTPKAILQHITQIRSL